MMPPGPPVNMMSNSPSELYNEEEDPCSICHEEMALGTTKMLECRHYFHDKVCALA